MSKQIKAILMSAGIGSRLRPITDETPKCLVEVGGIPMLERWLRKIEKLNCTQCIVNTHYMYNKVKDYVEKRTGSGMEVLLVHEVELLGTAGTLMGNKNFFKDCIGIMAHVDNATDVELNELVSAYTQRPEECIMTMLTFETNQPENCGIVETNEKGIITRFNEKDKLEKGKCANGAVFVFGEDLIDWITNNGKDAKDFSKEIVPKLVGKINAWHTDEVYIDIGNIKNLNEARRHFREGA